MLKKLPDIEIKPDSPFDHDALQRQEPIHLLTNLIESTQQPFVLSVEAPWGFGKTRFIRMWKAYLETKKHICFYFNAWENDFVDDPLVAFLGEMRALVEKHLGNPKENGPIKTNWENMKRIGGGVLRKTLPLAIKIATHGLLNQQMIKGAAEVVADEADNIGEFASTLAKERLDEYENEKEGINAFRNSLEQLTSGITEQTGHKPPLVFFVDELDRCRPDFAIALLERIKHLFNVKNVIFVLAIDRNQLNQCVRSLYGMDSKPDGYLRRFIDLAYQLPEPVGDAFAMHLYSRFSLNEINGFPHNQSLVKSFSDFANAFGLSLRAQEQCFTGINIVLRTNLALREFPVVLSFLTTLRAFDSDIIQELQSGRIEIEYVLDKIPNISNEQIKLWAEAAMLVKFSHGKNAAKRLQEIRRLISPGLITSGEEAAAQHAKQIKKFIDEIKYSMPNAVDAILSILTLSSRFT